MRLCASYHCKNPVLDEIRYPISMLNNAMSTIMERPNTIFIIEIPHLSEQELSAEKLKSLMDEQTNIVFDCYTSNDFIALKKAGFKRVMYHFPITTYNDLFFYLSYDPYGVILGEPLVFDLPQVRQAVKYSCDDYVQLRVWPTIGRPLHWNDLRSKDSGVRHFWIAPHMIYLYEPYIDVLELYDQDEGRETALVNIFDRGKTDYTLHEFLSHCESAMPVVMADEDFTQRRLSCRQVCMRGDNRCHLCDTHANLMVTLLASQS